MGMISDVLGSSVQGGVKKKTWASLHSFFDRIGSGGGWWGQGEKTQVAEQVKEYRDWIAAAVSVIYRRVSEIDYSFWRTDRDEELKKTSGTYRTISRIFEQPNEYMEFRAIKSFCQLQLDLFGMAFLLREDDPVFGTPLRLWPLNVVNLYKIEKGETFRDYIKGFTFRIGGELVTYSPDNICYLHYPSPVDFRDGWSPIRSQSGSVDIDTALTQYERMFFKNSARPDLAISYPPEVQLDPEEGEKIVAEWNKKFRGEDKFHRICLLDQGASLEKISVNNQDLALAFTAGFSRDKILACYNVPVGKMGIQKDINKDSSQSIEETFGRECIRPRLKLWDEVLTRKILQRFDPRLAIRHANPVPRDEEVLLEEHKIKTGVSSRTLNEQRLIDGQKSIGKKGDHVFIPLNYVALTDR